MYKLRRAVFALLALAQLTVAQTITGSISGTVTDQSGAAIPNLKVTAVNTSRNTTHEAITDAQGTFTITNLLPATYNIVVEASGFKRFEKTGVVLNTNENISVGTLALEVGSVNQTIQVSAQGQALETETAQPPLSESNYKISMLTGAAISVSFALYLEPTRIWTPACQTIKRATYTSMVLAGTR